MKLFPLIAIGVSAIWLTNCSQTKFSGSPSQARPLSLSCNPNLNEAEVGEVVRIQIASSSTFTGEVTQSVEGPSNFFETKALKKKGLRFLGENGEDNNINAAEPGRYIVTVEADNAERTKATCNDYRRNSCGFP